MLRRQIIAPALVSLMALATSAGPASAACCYFTAKDKDVNQPAQKAFITWDDTENIESFTVQPKFEGNALDFGMVVPTPGKPRLDEMPRDFFKELAVFTILKKREYPQSKILPQVLAEFAKKDGGGGPVPKNGHGTSTVKVLEAGVVGSLDYKIITAEKADDLYAWLKENKYSYSGDEETLNHYIKKSWFFTVMKIDTKQMKPKPDGSFDGEVTPTRFQFSSDKLVYPLRLTKISVKDHTEALFYIQAPYKVDLPGDLTYQYQWLPMLQNAKGWYQKGIFGPYDLPGKGDDWLIAARDQIPAVLQKGQQLGFNFVSGQRPGANKDGRIAATLEWARRLTEQDIGILTGESAYTQTLPDVDKGFDPAELNKDPRKAEAAYKVIGERIQQDRKQNPGGYLIRAAPKEDLEKLKLLKGHLKQGQFLTKIRKSFAKNEMDDDLLIVPARLGQAEDKSEYEEVLPTSPP